MVYSRLLLGLDQQDCWAKFTWSSKGGRLKVNRKDLVLVARNHLLCLES